METTGKQVHIFGGGTVNFIRNHLAITAPAYGSTARKLEGLVKERFSPDTEIKMHLTKMAGGDKLESNKDIHAEIENLVKDPRSMVVFFNCALADFEPAMLDVFFTNDGRITEGAKTLGKYKSRLKTSEIKRIELQLIPSIKLISKIRENRKDIFLVGFKTTCGASKQDMYLQGLNLCKSSSVNLVLVNDTITHHNMIITPEEAAYCETEDRDLVLKELVDIAYYRSHLKFTQSNVIEGTPVSWKDSRIPLSLRFVVDYCIDKKAYKVFNKNTVGHFATKLSDTEFLTSIRKSNFNNLNTTGLVYVKTDGPDTVIAYGAKPSVGGQSQRIVFHDHPGYDCIVHFHCPLKDTPRDSIPIKSQREVECGSHQCGKNTSEGLKQFGNLKAVMLDKHGPNIVFPKSINPIEVIEFIEANFDLDKKTGGYQL